MNIYIDYKLKNGFHLHSGAGTRSVDGIVTTINSTATQGIFRTCRYFNVNPGDIIKFSCLMAVSDKDKAYITLYKSDGVTEAKLLNLKSDEFALKHCSFTYTVPFDETKTLYGISFYTNNGILKIAKPQLEVIADKQPPTVRACALINLNAKVTNTNFPEFGIEKVEPLSTNTKVTKVTLSDYFYSSTTRPLVIATDATPTAVVNKNTLRASDISFADGKVTFYLYLIDSAGALVTPPENSSASVMVLY